MLGRVDLYFVDEGENSKVDSVSFSFSALSASFVSDKVVPEISSARRSRKLSLSDSLRLKEGGFSGLQLSLLNFITLLFRILLCWDKGTSSFSLGLEDFKGEFVSVVKPEHSSNDVKVGVEGEDAKEEWCLLEICFEFLSEERIKLSLAIEGAWCFLLWYLKED